MTAKTSRATREATAGDTTPLGQLADVGRQQLALATQSASALFRGCEAMRKIQQQAAHHASVRHEAVAQKLQGPCEPADLLALQASLLQFDLQGATQYWQDLAAAMLKTQVDMMGCASHLFDAVGSEDAFKPARDAWQAAMAGSLMNGTARSASAA